MLQINKISESFLIKLKKHIVKLLSTVIIVAQLAFIVLFLSSCKKYSVVKRGSNDIKIILLDAKDDSPFIEKTDITIIDTITGEQITKEYNGSLTTFKLSNPYDIFEMYINFNLKAPNYVPVKTEKFRGVYSVYSIKMIDKNYINDQGIPWCKGTNCQGWNHLYMPNGGNFRWETKPTVYYYPKYMPTKYPNIWNAFKKFFTYYAPKMT